MNRARVDKHLAALGAQISTINQTQTTTVARGNTNMFSLPESIEYQPLWTKPIVNSIPEQDEMKVDMYSPNSPFIQNLLMNVRKK